MRHTDRLSIYAEVTAKIVAQLEQGLVPWAQPWDAARCPCVLPHNAVSDRAYSGINILILWSAVVEHGYTSQRWLTYKQAIAVGGNVRRGEKGIVVCYADRFTPKDEVERARDENRDARSIAFLKRFVVFNVAQCEGLPPEIVESRLALCQEFAIVEADAVIEATGADFRVGGGEAYYSPHSDYVQVPPQSAFNEPVNWYRTALHELGHWTGHGSRLKRDQSGRFGSSAYAREELVAEMTSAFTCAWLGIEPTVRHADYIGAWLEIMRGDERAIFKAASAASKAADCILSCGECRP
jgi:antirestriction protein ArdC